MAFSHHVHTKQADVEATTNQTHYVSAQKNAIIACHIKHRVLCYVLEVPEKVV